jgi:hypothetical protein
MFGSGVLEVAIGIVLIYLLLSLICSTAREGLEALLKWRASDLERGILEMFGGEAKGAALCARLYNHPLINGLFRGDYATQKGNWWSGLPSYIPAPNFAEALISVLVRDPQAAAPPAAQQAAAPQAAQEAAAARQAAQQAAADHQAALARQAALPHQAAGAPPGTVAEQLKALAASVDAAQLLQLRAAIAALAGNDELRNGLLTLVDAAGNDMARARANIEAWFNSAMDQVSGWYKRWTQGVIFGLGLALVVLLNADTIEIGSSIARDPALRQTLIASAQESVKVRLEENKGSPEQQLAAEYRQLAKLGMPIGWDWNDPVRWPGTDPGRWLMKVIGLLGTALAISLGAPFWFDVLNKFMVVRAAVKPREKSPEEKSKD